MKIRAKFVNGSWTNDDIDLIPTIKLRTGSKTNSQIGMTVIATSIALCWLKWGIMISVGLVKEINKPNTYMYPQYVDLPSRILTRQELEQVLNYFLLPEHYELYEVYSSIPDDYLTIIILFKQPLFTHRIEKAKEYINKHKSVYIQVEYK